MCIWCVKLGHIEEKCYNKANGSARGGKSGSGRGRDSGVSRRGRGGDYSIFVEGEEEEEEQGHAEVLVGEVNMGSCDGDGDKKEWVCNSGAGFHMTGDISLFDHILPTPSTFFVKQIIGKVAIAQWWVVRLCTDGAGGKKREP